MIKERYMGIQTVFQSLGDEGCHFLTLCSIAEEYSGKPIDIIEAIRISQSKRWITPDFYVKNDGTPLLEYFTNVKWSRRQVTSLPKINDNDYTEVIYYNSKTGFRHYRRRSIDTLENSRTVREGKIEKYYIYTAETK